MNTDKTKALLICVYLCSSVAIFSSFGCGKYSNFTLPSTSGGDTSLVFRFVANPEPVLTREPFQDALNPSVADHFNLYSVYDGQWHTALAETAIDGTNWLKVGI